MRQSKLRELGWLSFPRSHTVSGRMGPGLFSSSSRLFPLKTSWPETSMWKVCSWSGHWSRFFPPHIVQRIGTQDTAVVTAFRRQWEGHGFDSLRTLSSVSDRLEMPVLPLTSLWHWPSYITSLVSSFLVYKIEIIICISKFARPQWDFGS